MSQNKFQDYFCNEYTKIANLDCKIESLFLIREIFSSNQESHFLKACHLCGQVYKEKVFRNNDNSNYSLFYKIPENRFDQCHCIGYLQTIQVLKEQKSNEGDPIYFSWEKETKMQCEKCGSFYIERIAQSNYDGFYFQTYQKDSR